MNNHMNRKERRAARKGDALFVRCGYLLPRDLNYGLPVECYVCGAAHKARHLSTGYVNIGEKRTFIHAPGRPTYIDIGCCCWGETREYD
jgi:hypothetical protein